MIFSIQRYLEDYFERRNLSDVDQYAVSLANLYDKRRVAISEVQFLNLMRKVRTVFYKNNSSLVRSAFDKNLLHLLDRHFEKKTPDSLHEFPGGVTYEQKRLSKKTRRSIDQILSEFKKAVESRAVDIFWESRKKNNLRPRPESIAQALIATFIKGVLSQNGSGLVMRELASGVGFVDVAVVLSRTPHLIEMKVVTGKVVGVTQLEQYLITEGRNEGWLILIDARPAKSKDVIEPRIKLGLRIIKTLSIDINPTPPSKR